MMKKAILVNLFLIGALIQISAQSNDRNLIQSATQASPWITETGLRYNMPILAQVFKDGTQFQPVGLILGVFKNNLCYGQSGLSNGPGGIKLHNVTIGCNNESEAGFYYLAYDPNTSTTYTISEMVDFKSLTPVGKINAPIQIHISGTTAIRSIQNEILKIYPNPIKTDFNISVDLESSLEANIQLFDIQGKLVQTIFKGNVDILKATQMHINSGIPNGIYLMKAKIGTRISNQKVILN